MPQTERPGLGGRPVLMLCGLILLVSQVILNQLIGTEITSPLISLLLAAI